MHLLKLVGIAVVAFVAIIAAVFVLKDTGMLTGGSATSKVSPVNLAIAEQPAYPCCVWEVIG
jgi:hypothetical protein